jgi:hypothetical protein
MPDRMPERMSEDMPDGTASSRSQWTLPDLDEEEERTTLLKSRDGRHAIRYARKNVRIHVSPTADRYDSILVKVGITRSKVFDSYL